jgi:hypothetical protein
MEAMIRQITVEIKKASGKYRLYPMCSLGQLLHGMAGCTTKSFDEETIRDLVERDVEIINDIGDMRVLFPAHKLEPERTYYGHKGQRFQKSDKLIGYIYSTDERWSTGWNLVELY